MSDDFGDRMKMYEKLQQVKLLPLLPVIIRLDGKCFSNFTKGLARPFDQGMIDAMVETTSKLVEYTSAVIGYTQSDEITLVLYFSSYKSSTFMNGRVDKLNSVLAAKASLWFNDAVRRMLPEGYAEKEPVFDCRSWNVPNKEEAVNAVLWREKDATKNSISMCAQVLYSHSELMHCDSAKKQEMLFSKGVNWNDYPDSWKRGTYIRKSLVQGGFTTEELDSLPLKHNARKSPETVFFRGVIAPLNMKPLLKVENRVGVFFDGEEPRDYENA